MRNFIIFLVSAIAATVAFFYLKAYLIWRKLSLKIVNFNLKDADGNINIKENTEVIFLAQNNTNFGIKINTINMYVENANGQIIGTIGELKDIEIPKNGQVEIPVKINNIRMLTLVADFASGRINDYKLVTRVRFYRVFIFKNKSKLIQ